MGHTHLASSGVAEAGEFWPGRAHLEHAAPGEAATGLTAEELEILARCLVPPWAKLLRRRTGQGFDTVLVSCAATFVVKARAVLPSSIRIAIFLLARKR